jgi:hypothetical protein
MLMTFGRVSLFHRQQGLELGVHDNINGQWVGSAEYQSGLLRDTEQSPSKSLGRFKKMLTSGKNFLCLFFKNIFLENMYRMVILVWKFS